MIIEARDGGEREGRREIKEGGMGEVREGVGRGIWEGGGGREGG